MNYLGRIGAVSVVLLLSTYYAVSYYLHYGELTVFEFSGDIIYLALAYWGGLHFDKARVLTKNLQSNKQELQNIFKYTVDSIVVRDLEGIILEVNPAYEKMTGYTKEEVVGKRISFIKGREEDIKQLIQDMLEKGEDISGLKVVYEKKNGELLYCNISFSLIRDKKGNPERIVGIKRDITEQEKDDRALKESEQKLKETNAILKQYSSLDGLTGIANRRYFDDILEKEWNIALNHKHSLSLIMLDIDYFKKYNDTYGHLDGDECLKQVACALDTIGKKFGALAARYGGEEFVVLLPNLNREKVLEIAEMLRIGIEKLAILHVSSEIKDIVTVSVGVSTCIPVINVQPTDLIQLADKALYHSKRLGRNRVSCDVECKNLA